MSKDAIQGEPHKRDTSLKGQVESINTRTYTPQCTNQQLLEGEFDEE